MSKAEPKNKEMIANDEQPVNHAKTFDDRLILETAKQNERDKGLSIER